MIPILLLFFKENKIFLLFFDVFHMSHIFFKYNKAKHNSTMF